MAKRDQVTEIAELQARQGRFVDIQAKVADLEELWRQPIQPPVSDFFAMRVVTLLEVFGRQWIATFIDHGPPYVDKSKALVESGIKFDFDKVKGIHGKKISLGQLVAHSVSLNQFDQFVWCFSKLLDKDLLKAIERTHDRATVELYGQPPTPIISDASVMTRDLRRLFQVRHVLTHEYPVRSATIEDISSFLRAASEFVRASEQTFATLLYGNYAFKAVDMASQATELKNDAEDELRATLAKVGELPFIDADALRLSQDTWEEYRKNQAALRASIVQGGSLYGQSYVKELFRLARLRNDELRWWLDREDGEI